MPGFFYVCPILGYITRYQEKLQVGFLATSY